MTGEPEDDGTRAFIDFEGLGVLSRAAFRLHGFAIVNSLKDGHPGFVSDEYLNAISAETTVTVLELEAAGIWERRTDGYLIIADDMLRRLVEHNELQGKQAAVCDARGTHVPGEFEGSGRVLCADCGTPIARPESGQAPFVPETKPPTASQAASETYRRQSWRASRSRSVMGGPPTRPGGGTTRAGNARRRSQRRATRIGTAATVEADKVRGTYIEPSKITVAEYARGWVEARPHRPTTARRTEMMMRLHIEGTRLGGRTLADVRPSEVQAWATDRSRVLAPTTLRQAVGLLRSAYGAAVLDRLVASSPVIRIQLPRHETDRIVPLSVEQVAALAEAMPERYQIMVLTQAGLGLRIGELLALRAQDVDFLRRTVRIEWQFTQGSKGERSEPKTPRSRRTVPLPRVIADALAAHLAAYPAAEDGTIFTTGRGAPLGHATTATT